jgi:2-C-methyl-D-erythritol 4-phosphate cytidylyltransferase
MASLQSFSSLVAVVPAAGVGKRMESTCPKQYLKINGLTILEHSVLKLLSHPDIAQVILVISEGDEYFTGTSLATHSDIIIVYGGNERVDSVLAGLKAVDETKNHWVLVHDAARPCLESKDIDALITSCRKTNHGGILASLVRDTMKSSDSKLQVTGTVERSILWHALTPQMFETKLLINAIEQALVDKALVTDESSAIEHVGLPSLLVAGSSENIKITRPEDLALAAFYLTRINKDNLCE